MYEESAGIPMLVAGEGVPAKTIRGTPVTLCDVSATILDAVGATTAIEELRLPGTSLLDLATEPSKHRTVLSEFPRRVLHAARPTPQICLLCWRPAPAV